MEKKERWDWNRNKSLLSKIFKNCLKAWTERSAVKWKFNYGGFGSDDNPRTLSWLARKLWKQKSSKDICSCSATHLWACCRLWKHGINPCLKKNPQLLTEIQKFCYVNDEKKTTCFQILVYMQCQKNWSFWFYHHFFETDIPDLILGNRSLKDLESGMQILRIC